MKLTKTTPFKHQDHVIQLSKDSPFYALFMEQGTGKSLVGIATFTHLYREGLINGVIIVAPNGVHDNWTRLEIPKHCLVPQDQMLIATWHGSDGAKARRAYEYAASSSAPDGLLVVLAVNIEALRTEAWWEATKDFIENRNFLLIVDESTVVKNPKAQQTKNCIHLAAKSSFRRIMTGTPITQSPLDLFAQCKVLDPKALPYTSYTAFKHEFAVEQVMHMGNRSFNKVVGYKNQEKLAGLIAPFSYRVLKKDCLDLPEKVYQTRFVELTPEQKRIYRDLSEQCLAQLGKDKGMVTVTTVITMMLRLHQVVLGYVPNDNPKEMVAIPHNRLKVLESMLEENPSKAIIFCRFLEDVHQVTQMLYEMPGAPDVVTYTGEDNAERRSFAVDTFQNDPTTKYFVATNAASKGLTLTAAEQVVYYSQGYSLETRLQSEDRAHRSGQTKTVVYTDMCSQGTVEDAIVAALLAKKNLADSVMDLAAVQQLLRLKD